MKTEEKKLIPRKYPGVSLGKTTINLNTGEVIPELPAPPKVEVTEERLHWCMDEFNGKTREQRLVRLCEHSESLLSELEELIRDQPEHAQIEILRYQIKKELGL